MRGGWEAAASGAPGSPETGLLGPPHSAARRAGGRAAWPGGREGAPPRWSLRAEAIPVVTTPTVSPKDSGASTLVGEQCCLDRQAGGKQWPLSHRKPTAHRFPSSSLPSPGSQARGNGVAALLLRSLPHPQSCRAGSPGRRSGARAGGFRGHPCPGRECRGGGRQVALCRTGWALEQRGSGSPQTGSNVPTHRSCT